MKKLTDSEIRERFEAGRHLYKGYEVRAMRDFYDFAAFDRGFYIRDGYIVIKDGTNAIPGALWFRTLDDARFAIDILCEVGTDKFHVAHRMFKDAVDIAREEALMQIAKLFGAAT